MSWPLYHLSHSHLCQRGCKIHIWRSCFAKKKVIKFRVRTNVLRAICSLPFPTFQKLFISFTYAADTDFGKRNGKIFSIWLSVFKNKTNKKPHKSSWWYCGEHLSNVTSQNVTIQYGVMRTRFYLVFTCMFSLWASICSSRKQNCEAKRRCQL